MKATVRQPRVILTLEMTPEEQKGLMNEMYHHISGMQETENPNIKKVYDALRQAQQVAKKS